MFEELFEPIRVNTLEIKNRIAMAPMYAAGLTEPGGTYSQRAIDYFEERAKGGAGLIITGVNRVEGDIEKLVFLVPYPTPTNMSNFKELAETVHYHGAKVFLQLTPGFGRNAPIMPGVRPVSASAVPAYFDPSVTCRSLEVGEIERIVQGFGEVAEILVQVGVDGVEIHGHEGYLLDQFATALWNKRADKYGGSLAERLRLAIEIVQKIKERVGDDWPVTYRYGLKHYLKAFDQGAVPGEPFEELGRDLEESTEMARLLEAGGYDGLHIDAGGSYNSYYWAHPPMYMEHGVGLDKLIGRIKQAVKIPVMVCSRFDKPELAAKVLQEKQADMIVLGRGLLADSEWPQKVWEGRISEIRPCIGCDTGCQGRMNDGGVLACAVNPTTCRERLWALSPVAKKKRIMVIGGGVAGMEASRVLAERGHAVTLYEKSSQLGGHLIEAGVPEFKKDIRRLLAWYKNEIKRLAVPVFMNRPADMETVEAEKPDEIIVATGSVPVIPCVPGMDRSGVVTAVDLFRQKEISGNRVVVVGGGLVGCEAALWLADMGKQVMVVEKLSKLMPQAIDHNANKELLVGSLKFKEISVRTETAMVGLREEGVDVVDRNQRLEMIPCDAVVLAVGMKSEDALWAQLREKKYRVHKVGDCQIPRIILNAVWDGYHIANAV